MLVLGTLTLILIILTLTMLTQPLTTMQKDSCKGVSILQRYNAWVQGVSLGTAKPLSGFRMNTLKTVEQSCPPRIIHISKRTRDRLARQIIANEFARCWNLYGQGRINYAPNAAGNINYCMPCTYITLDKPLTGLVSYLTTTRIPGLGITYADYFMGGGMLEQPSSPYPQRLPPGDYVILFYQDVTGDLWRVLTTSDVTAIPTKSGVEGTVASILGKSIRTYTVFSRTRSLLTLLTEGTGIGLLTGIAIGAASAGADIYGSTHPTQASSTLLFLPLTAILSSEDTQCADIVKTGSMRKE